MLVCLNVCAKIAILILHVIFSHKVKKTAVFSPVWEQRYEPEYPNGFKALTVKSDFQSCAFLFWLKACKSFWNDAEHAEREYRGGEKKSQHSIPLLSAWSNAQRTSASSAGPVCLLPGWRYKIPPASSLVLRLRGVWQFRLWVSLPGHATWWSWSWKVQPR